MPGLRSATNALLIAASQSPLMATTQSELQLDAGVIAHRDRTEWDRLTGTLGAQPFQSWAWGELKSEFGWQPYRLSSADGSHVAQLLIRPFRGLSVAYVPRGPVSAGGVPPSSELIGTILELARSRRAAFVRFEPDVLEADPAARELDSGLKSAGFRAAERTLQPRSSIRLDLAPEESELMAGFSKGHRADLRRAERDGVTVRVGTTESEVDLLHAMLVATQQRKNFAIHSAAYYRALWRLFADSARLLIAERDGSPVAASLVLAWADNGIYLVAGSSPAGLEARAAHALQWHAIRWARERGAQTWDMWGIADARGRHELALDAGANSGSPEMTRLEDEARRDPLDGVYRFKKGWGGKVVRTVPAYDRVFIPPIYWLWQRRRGEA